MARRRSRLLPLQRRLQGVSFGFAVLAGMALLLLLLPVILPLLALSEALQERRLARFACVSCGHPIGREAIQRARREAAEANPRGSSLDGIRYRIVAVWTVICPACGHRYTYRPSHRAALVPESAGAARS